MAFSLGPTLFHTEISWPCLPRSPLRGLHLQPKKAATLLPKKMIVNPITDIALGEPPRKMSV